jgi:transposase
MESLSLIKDLLSVFFPAEITQHFEIKSVDDKKEYIEIRFYELPELVPPIMKEDKEIVLDGFCNPLELQSFPLKGKPVYLKLYRRRWKFQGEKKHYSNTYNFNPDGVKATKEFASFLKAAFGQTPDQYNSDS